MTSYELIAGINQKDEYTWKLFFNSYYDSLYRHAYRILKEEKTAEDIVQELFIALWNSDTRLENEKVLTVYLYRSVTNRCLNYIRNKNREDARLSRWIAENGEDTDTGSAEFSSVVREEVFRRLQELIEQLPNSQRTILLMSMQGMSGDDIARQLGISITTVKQQKYRAYNYLRRHLGKHWIIILILFIRLFCKS